MAPPFGARGNATWAIHRRRALASGCALAFQKCDRQHVEAIGMFVLRPMSAFVEDLELRPRDILMHRRRLGHAAERVVRSPDDEGRRADLGLIFWVKQVALPAVPLDRKRVVWGKRVSVRVYL